MSFIVEKNVVTSAEADGEGVGWIAKTGSQNADGHQNGAARVTLVAADGTNLSTGLPTTRKKGAIAPVVVGTQPDTTARLLLAANANRLEASFYNNGAQTVYLSSAPGVTTASFIIALLAGGFFVDDASTSAWYGITAAGTADIKVGETV